MITTTGLQQQIMKFYHESGRTLSPNVRFRFLMNHLYLNDEVIRKTAIDCLSESEHPALLIKELFRYCVLSWFTSYIFVQFIKDNYPEHPLASAKLRGTAVSLYDAVFRAEDGFDFLRERYPKLIDGFWLAVAIDNPLECFAQFSISHARTPIGKIVSTNFLDKENRYIMPAVLLYSVSSSIGE